MGDALSDLWCFSEVIWDLLEAAEACDGESGDGWRESHGEAPRSRLSARRRSLIGVLTCRSTAVRRQSCGFFTARLEPPPLPPPLSAVSGRDAAVTPPVTLRSVRPSASGAVTRHRRAVT